MDSDVWLLAAIYTVPFLVLGFLPGWRIIAAGVLLTLAFWFWAFAVRTNSGGLDGIVEIIFAWLAGTGLVGGLAASSLVKLARNRGYSKPLRIAIWIATFIAAPLISFVIANLLEN